MRKQCDICGESSDEEYLYTYETLTPKKDIINVCEFNCDKESDFDEELKMKFFSFENGKFYSTYDVCAKESNEVPVI